MYDENGPFYTPDDTEAFVKEASAAIDKALAKEGATPKKQLSDKERRAIRKQHRQLQRAVSLSTQRNGDVHATWEFTQAYCAFYGLREAPPHWRCHEARWAYTPAFDTYKGRDGSEKTRQAYLAERVERTGYSSLALRHMRRRNGVGRPPAVTLEAMKRRAA